MSQFILILQQGFRLSLSLWNPVICHLQGVQMTLKYERSQDEQPPRESLSVSETLPSPAPYRVSPASGLPQHTPVALRAPCPPSPPLRPSSLPHTLSAEYLERLLPPILLLRVWIWSAFPCILVASVAFGLGDWPLPSGRCSLPFELHWALVLHYEAGRPEARFSSPLQGPTGTMSHDFSAF